MKYRFVPDGSGANAANKYDIRKQVAHTFPAKKNEEAKRRILTLLWGLESEDTHDVVRYYFAGTTAVR